MQAVWKLTQLQGKNQRCGYFLTHSIQWRWTLRISSERRDRGQMGLFKGSSVFLRRTETDLAHSSVLFSQSGVALTFEKLRISNAQHGKNCVSSPAAKTTISTDLPKICPGHDRAGLHTAHRPFWLRHQQYVGTSIPSPGWDGEGRGEGAGEI